MLQVHNLAVIGEGWESEIVGLDCEIEAEPLELVLRLYTGAGGSEKAVVEGEGIPKLFDASYPVPRVYHTEPSPGSLGRPFIVMARAAGSELRQHLSQASRQSAVDLGIEFIDLLADLHRVPTSAFLDFKADDPHHFVRGMLQQWRNTVETVGAESMSPALEWFEQHVPDIQPLPPAVTHNDFHPGNIMRDDNSRMTVIDWTGLTIADPRSDLAWTLLLREIYGAPGASDVERERYASQLPIPDLEFFEAAARLRRLFSLIISMTVGPEALGMRAGAEGQMRLEMSRSASSYERFRSLTSLRLTAYEQLRQTVAESEHGTGTTSD